MAYKVVCTKCGKPVKVVVSSDGKYWDVKCQCARSVKGEWEIQESGVIPLSDRRKYCVGCYENFYNGNNTVGVKECWNLKSAKLVMKKKVGIDDVPPWNHTPIKCLSCYHETGYVMVDSKATY
jgi:hypothetical protein